MKDLSKGPGHNPGCDVKTAGLDTPQESLNYGGGGKLFRFITADRGRRKFPGGYWRLGTKGGGTKRV